MGKATPSYTPAANSKNLSRYIRHKQGLAIEDIAQEDGVKQATVMASIRAIEAQRFLHTPEFATEGIVGALVDTKDELRSALRNGLTAKKAYFDNETNKSVEFPDVEMQLEAVEKYAKLTTAIQKKETRNQTQVNVAVGAKLGGAPAVGGFIGVEDRVRRLRERMEAQKQLPQESQVVAPPEEGEEAEYSVDSQ